MNRSLLIVFVLALLLTMAGVAYAATLTPQVITTSGLVITPVAATGTTYEFANDGHQAIYINNGSGGTLYYTVTVPGTVGGYSLEDITGSVANGAAEYVGPFNPTYTNASDGNVDFTISTTDTVTLAVIELK